MMTCSIYPKLMKSLISTKHLLAALVILFGIMTWRTPAVWAQVGNEAPITGSGGGYDKPHQNRPFYHAGSWWTTAKKSSDDKWYLWKLYGENWLAELEIDSRKSTRPDCYVDSPANKLYILLASSSSSGTKFLRLSFANGAWSIDAGFPVTLSSFVFSGESGNVLTKAKNGELWAFRYKSSQVDGKRSSDDGLTWSTTFIVQSGLYSSGLCDAVAFTSGGENYVGVGYSENTSSTGKFGFLLHKDGDSEGTWSDETSVMPQFDNAQSDDHLALAVSQNNEIFFACKTHPLSSSAARIGLLKRSAGGGWQNFIVQGSSGNGWTRPAVVVDETNNELYVFGTQENSPDHGQYKKCAIGDESSLQNAAVVDIFDDAGFNNLSVPQHRVNGATELLVCAEKNSGSAIWYNLLPIDGSGVDGGSLPSALIVNNITVAPNFADQTAEYNIQLTLGAGGVLTGGIGTMTITWPSGTIIPAMMASSTVTVNGSPAGGITTDPVLRRAVITVPNTLENNASVALIFTNVAGIINPSVPASYQLQAQTSAEPTAVNSSHFFIESSLPPAGALTDANTMATLAKSNQSKLFYFQSAWWLVAFDANATDWFLWKFQGGVWSRDLKIETRSDVRIDAVLGTANNRLYYVSSHESATQFGRLFYANGAWTVEMALVEVADFGDGGGNPVSLTRANNGELWLFRLNGTALEAKLSQNNGATWSSTITLKSGLAGSGGVAAGTAFPEGGAHYAGVFYGMTAANGGTSFGFLRHRNGAPSNVWTDESSALTFFGNERADDWVSVAKADNGRLFVLTCNSNAASSGEVKNTLYKRNSAGSWSKFKVNTGVEWSSPAVGIDDTNDRIYVMGVRAQAPNFAEYKVCNFGSENMLETQTATVLLNNNGDNFGDLTAPGKSLYSASGLLVCGGNLAGDDVWYRQINFDESGQPPAVPSAGALVDVNTTATLAKSNQSKLFYFQSAWWLAAFDANTTDWFLWKFQGGVWSRDLKIETRTTVSIDLVLETANNRLYYVSSHESATQFGRLLYVNGGWAEEMALVNVENFGDGSGSPVSLARANNGELWLFRLNGSALEAKLSTDNGATWSSTIALKSGLAGSGGVTDGTAFPEGGAHFAGVFYGMTAANGGASFGFLRHRNGDPSNVWTDESSALTFFGNERADDCVSVAKADNGRLYVLTRNSNAAATGEVKNTLYKRNAAGSWSKFKVNISVEWNSPAVGIDDTNDRVYVMGVRAQAPNYAEYKVCNFGHEQTLEAQTAKVLLNDNGDTFGDLTAPDKALYNASGLLVCGGNLTSDDVWYRQINFSAPKAAARDSVAGVSNDVGLPRVSIYPNPFNPATTIRFNLNAPAPVALQIFNLRGELVTTLVERTLDAGVHAQRWNGRDDFNRPVASGVYFYRLQLGAEIFRGRLQMVK